ncbi:hypothetical protein EMIHUDRAFT_97072 [Emiliania huxleyi CCMP1516]|uniref:Fe2OG dioxygenase domain-containing protein n=2 Tax=Emiliania huxleyi TaxID=2903 RepID=A0A0D3I7M1_EMIH1|nr:hypothetical protein EMIHUDRAFT_97072 [Emiliania huxleyi CCMP1516]EOD07256.1 hypothetical protein EMIHUDRAFT_97072 [Emiliania huxleyi CCMP1516]|eukprot:XP_005759685.1 hypothetical protein EMIHUDRAFT_97072 [Emiliania huxleyi CCMP1516]
MFRLLFILISTSITGAAETCVANNFVAGAAGLSASFLGAFTPSECAKLREASRSAATNATADVRSNPNSDAPWVSRTYVVGDGFRSDGPSGALELPAWAKQRLLSLALTADRSLWRLSRAESDGLEAPIVSTYVSPADHFGWHVDQSVEQAAADASAGRAGRLLAIALQLSSPGEYEGGELEVGASVAPRGVGDLVVFPAATGARVALIAWLRGGGGGADTALELHRRVLGAWTGTGEAAGALSGDAVSSPPAAVLSLLAAQLEQAGRHAEALPLLQRAAAQQPDDAAARNRRGGGQSPCVPTSTRGDMCMCSTILSRIRCIRSPRIRAVLRIH